MSAVLRIDLGQPLPFRRTPEFLFGDVRRRARRLGGAAGGVLAVVAVAGWWVAGNHHALRGPADQAAVSRPVVARAGNAPRTLPRDDVFPLIDESRASRATREAEELPLALVTPILDEVAPQPAVTAPPAELPAEAPALAVPPLVGEEPPAAPVVAEPTPAPTDSAPPQVVGEAAPAEPQHSEDRPVPGSPAHHYLQFGTYRLEESVTTVQREYQMMGLSTIIQREGNYYVLRLLPFATKVEAEEEQVRLKEMGIETLYIPPPASWP